MLSTRSTGSTRPLTGRLHLPEQVIALTRDDPDLGPVNAFAERLAEIPLADWLAVGRLVIHDVEARSRRAASYRLVEASIAGRRLAIAAWYVRDVVETAAHYASGTRRWKSQERREFAAAHAAAEEAALALLARSFLSDSDLNVLCEPFAETVAAIAR